MVGIRTRLDRTLDANKLKPGDPVTARPEAKIRISPAVELAPSTLLLGRVDAVEPSAHHGDSTLTITFDTARLKGGPDLPIHATILWIGNSPNQLTPTMHSAPADRATPGVGVEAGMSATPNGQGYVGSDVAGPPVSHHEAVTPVKSPADFAQKNGIPFVDLESSLAGPESGAFHSRGMGVYLPEGTVLAIGLSVLGEPRARP